MTGKKNSQVKVFVRLLFPFLAWALLRVRYLQDLDVEGEINVCHEATVGLEHPGETSCEPDPSVWGRIFWSVFYTHCWLSWHDTTWHGMDVTRRFLKFLKSRPCCFSPRVASPRVRSDRIRKWTKRSKKKKKDRLLIRRCENPGTDT